MKDVRAQFGRRVRELRLANGVTQEQLAEMSGLSYKFIGEIERGQGNPTLSTMRRLSTGLGVRLQELFAPPFEDSQSDMTYRLRKRELQMVREALHSANALLKRISPARRRRRKRTTGQG